MHSSASASVASPTLANIPACGPEGRVGALKEPTVLERGVLVNKQLVEMEMSRREAAENARIARARGFIEVAEGYERVVAGWDALLARNAVNADNKLQRG